MSAPADAAAALAVEPSLEEVRALARDHDLVPLRHTFIDDCETPVSAFLKLRGAEKQTPAFLLESAEQGQRVGRYSFIGVQPRDVVRWSLGDDGDPYSLAEEAAALQAGDVRGRPAVHRRRGRLLRLRPRPDRRDDARRAQPGRARAAGHGADAVRPAGGLRPPQAHGHDPRQRPRRRRRRLLRRGGPDDRRRPRAARRAGAQAGRRRAASARSRSSPPTWTARRSRAWSRGSSSTCTRATRSRSCPRSAGAPTSAGSTRSASTAGCGSSTRRRTCTSWTSWTSRSPAPRPSRC